MIHKSTDNNQLVLSHIYDRVEPVTGIRGLQLDNKLQSLIDELRKQGKSDGQILEEIKRLQSDSNTNLTRISKYMQDLTEGQTAQTNMIVDVLLGVSNKLDPVVVEKEVIVPKIVEKEVVKQQIVHHYHTIYEDKDGNATEDVDIQPGPITETGECWCALLNLPCHCSSTGYGLYRYTCDCNYKEGTGRCKYFVC